jgi:hypothetical protein
MTLTQSLRHTFSVSRIEVTSALAAQDIDVRHWKVVRPGGLELPTFWFVASYTGFIAGRIGR